MDSIGPKKFFKKFDPETFKPIEKYKDTPVLLSLDTPKKQEKLDLICFHSQCPRKRLMSCYRL